MFRVFKKTINPIHTYRDYEDIFSSKNDVISPTSATSPTELKSPASALKSTTLLSRTFGTRDKFRSPTKVQSVVFERKESNDTDELETSFKKKHAEFNYHNKSIILCKRSLYIFGEHNQLRKLSVYITEALAFQLLTFSIVTFNAILLGLHDYVNPNSTILANQILNYINPVFIAYYLLEGILKVIARGLINEPSSYLRSGWNWIDLFVIISGLIISENSLKYFSILRILRLLELLTPFKRFKSINDMLTVIYNSSLTLLSIMGLLTFFMILFAIIGIHIYSGSLDYRCRLTPVPVGTNWDVQPDLLRICGFSFKCDAEHTCGSNYDFPDVVANPSTATYYEDFNWGLTNFDNVFAALFTVLIIINGNWRNLMQMLSDSENNVSALIYCFVTYIVCKFFIIQLAVAVMLNNFSNLKEKENPKKVLLTSAFMSKDGTEFKPDSSAIEGSKAKFKLKAMLHKYFPAVRVPSGTYYKNPFCYWAYKITFHELFKYVTICLSIFNMIIVAVDRYPIDPAQEDFIVKTNNALTILYIVEVCLKMIAQSVPKFLQENFNIIESIIAIISLIEISRSNGVSAISILRVVRLMRYMRREYTWDNFKVLITVVFEGFTYIVDFSIILGLYIYVFSVIGMKFFAGQFRFDTNGYQDLVNGFTPRANFDTLKEAFTTVVQIVIGDDVLTVILAAIRATGWASVAYFIVLVATGKYLLIQMFLSLILGTFEEARYKVNYGHLASRFIVSRFLGRRRNKKIASIGSIKAIQTRAEDKSYSTVMDRSLHPSRIAAEDASSNWMKNSKEYDEMDEHVQKNQLQEPADHGKEDSTRKNLLSSPAIKDSHSEVQSRVISKSRTLRDKTMRVHPEIHMTSMLAKKITAKLDKRVHASTLLKIKQILQALSESSLLIFHKNSRIRRMTNWIIGHKMWEILILMSILMSSILLLLDNPLNNPDDYSTHIYDMIDIAFTALFGVEMVLKIVSYGFLFNWENNSKAYIRNYWNMLDCLVVVTSMSDVITGGSIGLKSLKALRALRALRPLRVISRNEDLKLLVNALFRTLPSLRNLMVVAGLMMIMAATIGTGFMKGTFYTCSDSTGEIDISKIVTKQDCFNAGGSWINQTPSFDNFLQAMLTFFTMITGEGWVDALYLGVDSIGIDLQPKWWGRSVMVLYFYLFLLIGNVLIKNLFVGVVIDNFRQMGEELGGFLMLNDMQRSWVEMQKFMQRKKLKRIILEPENTIRKICFYIAQHSCFETFKGIIIIINAILLALRFRDQSPELENAVDVLTKTFLALFHVEAFIAVLGLGWFYIKDSWNKFDVFVLVSSDVVLIVCLITNNPKFATLPTIIRALRLGRIVKFFRASKHFRVLIETMYFLLPSLANIGLLLVLMMFIYAVLGIYLFSGVQPQTFVNEYANFQSLQPAMNVLIRCAIGQDWPYFMAELGNQDIPGCQVNQSYDDTVKNGIQGCGTWVSYVYFISYVIFVTLIIMNLFLTAVVGGYVESKKENEAIISPNQMEEFLDKWAEYDPQGEGLITPEQFAFLIHDLPHPLGLKDNASVKYEYDLALKKSKGYLVSENKKIVLKRIQLFRDMRKFNISVYNNKVHFADVCRVISFNAVVKTYKSGNKAGIADLKGEGHTERDLRNDNAIEEDLRQRVIINSEYVIRSLGRGWINRYSNIKKLQKEARQGKVKIQYKAKVTSYYAGQHISTFWKKWREEKRLYALQIAEKKGAEYDKTFEHQQRLANSNVPNNKTLRKGRATRIYDKKKSSRKTITSVSAIKDREAKNAENEQEDYPKATSIAYTENGDTPAKSRMSYSSNSDEEDGTTSKGNFEKLIEYKNNNHNVARRRTSLMSNFLQARHYSNTNNVNEFWLQPVVSADKFPVPVTVEVDKFMLNYLEQPETFHSGSTDSLPDDKPGSAEIETPKMNFSNLRSARKDGKKSDQVAFSEENISPGSSGSVSPKKKVMSMQRIASDESLNSKESPLIKVAPSSSRSQGDLDSPSTKSAKNNAGPKVKERAMESPGRPNLATIEEKHEEDMHTRADIDSLDKSGIRPLNLKVKSLKAPTIPFTLSKDFMPSLQETIPINDSELIASNVLMIPTIKSPEGSMKDDLFSRKGASDSGSVKFSGQASTNNVLELGTINENLGNEEA